MFKIKDEIFLRHMDIIQGVLQIKINMPFVYSIKLEILILLLKLMEIHLFVKMMILLRFILNQEQILMGIMLNVQNFKILKIKLNKINVKIFVISMVFVYKGNVIVLGSTVKIKIVLILLILKIILNLQNNIYQFNLKFRLLS